MKVRRFGIYAIILWLLCAVTLSAQDLPLLPQHPAVKCSVFPNGLSCYVAQNNSCKGLADFALLKKTYDGKDLVCTLNGVIMSEQEKVDSALLSMVRIVEKEAAPADHALVVCGDVDMDSILTKLRYMSFMIDASASSTMPEYEWEGESALKVTVAADTLKGLSTVHVQWQSPRTPQEYLPTIQTAVYKKAVWEFGHVAELWIRRELCKLNIPYAEVSYLHNDGIRDFSHEHFLFDVTVSSENVQKAQDVVTSVLSMLDRGEVLASDVVVAENDYLRSLEKSARQPVVDNDVYMSMCRDAFLYNNALSTDKERLAFLRSKALSDASRKQIFSSIVSALIPSSDSTAAQMSLSSGVMLSDTLGLPGQNAKVNLRSSRNDSFSGGTLWTFANGFKVLYKKMPTERKLYYSMSLGGGYANIDDLKRGEGAYQSDYMDCCWIAGMKGSDFKSLLNLAGMTLDTKVNLFNTVLFGQVEDRNADLLMKALLAIANERRLDKSYADYYVRCEKLRHTFAGTDVKEAVDELLCPGYEYSPFKTMEGASESAFSKADELFSMLTSKMNDGMLVIVGDMNEVELRKLLQLYVGGFKVKTFVSRRPAMQYHPVSGWTSHSAEGDGAAVVVITAPLAMTSQNHFATEMAAMVLKRRLEVAFEPLGVSVGLSYARGLYPDERFSVMITISGDGHSQEDVAKLKVILAECCEGVTEQELNACKEYVKNVYALQHQSPWYWLRVIPLRHLEGKDFTTGFQSKVDAVTVDALQTVFKALDNGAGIEYITTKK